MKNWHLALALTVAAALVPGSASAQDAKAIKKIEDTNRAAMEDYDLLEFESAKKQLGDALVLVKKGKLEKHAVAARTHMNLAIVAGGGLKDNQTALLEFMSALEIDPELPLDPVYKTPDLQKLYDQARADLSRSGTPVVGPGPGPGDNVTGIRHEPVEEAKEGEAIELKVSVGADVRAKQVLLFYRPAGAEDFTAVVMESADGVNFRGVIPVEATHADTIHYYMEARNAGGRAMAGVGSSGSPNVIMITRQEKGSHGGGDDTVDDENPLKNKGGGGDDDGHGGDETPRGPKNTAVFFNLMVGTGGGVPGGKTEVTGQTVSGGLAFAPFHITPELGYRFNTTLAVSLVGRIGLPIGANVTGAATADPSGFLRVTFLPSPGVGIHGDLGGGFLRQIVPLASGNQVDTAVSGPLLLGAGAMFVMPLGGPVRFVADVTLQIGIPVVSEIGGGAVPIQPGFGVNLDANLGLSFAF